MSTMKAKELKVRRLKIEASIAELELKVDQDMVAIERVKEHIKLQEAELVKIQAEEGKINE